MLKKLGIRNSALSVHSAGGFVVNPEKKELEFLLIKNSFDDRWTIPKGHLDPGESAEQAAVREISEEAGVTSKVIEHLGKNKYSFRYRGRMVHKQVDVYLLELVGSARLDPEKFDPVDHLVKDARWFDASTTTTAIGYKNLRELSQLAVTRAKELYA